MTSDTETSAELTERAVAHWQQLMTNWRRRALRNRAASKLFGYGCITLSVATTALSGISTVPRWWIVMVSAAAALAAGLMNASKSHEQWTLSREVQNRLYAERFLFEQGAGAYGDLSEGERARLFSVRLTEIGMAGHDSWASYVLEGAASQPKPAPPR